MNISNFGFSGGGSQNLSGYVPYDGVSSDEYYPSLFNLIIELNH